MTPSPVFDGPRLIARLAALGEVGRDSEVRLTRLAASDQDAAGRALVAGWMREAGLAVELDRIGNLYGVWAPEGAAGDPLVMGSHIDSVIDAGIYDGCLGVLAGLGAIEAMIAAGIAPARPLAVVAWTNEEGVRYAPDMLGSLVAAGGMEVETALAVIGTDGTRLGEELARIGALGPRAPGFLRPHAYLELHVEQGPALEAEGLRLGAVESLQGISWTKVRIGGAANHAGTTPMAMRRDAGVAAARVIAGLDAMARATPGAVATVGTMRLAPGAINVIPALAEFTVDLRNPDETRLQAQEAALAAILTALRAEGYSVATEPLARFAPVIFDESLVERIEGAAARRRIPCRRMTSGAGHDAQMMARIAPAAMIFTPSRGGISHNPAEFTDEADLIAGAEILLDVAEGLIR